MTKCPFFNTCKWIQKYSSTGGAKVNYFVRNYCKGDSLRRCVRKKVAEQLGGREFVPDNMQPDGTPIKGTNDSEWPEKVRKVVRSIHEQQHLKH